MSFDTLGLSANLLRAITEQGYTEPTPIQAQAIPVVLQGKDVMAAAQTGTGKTASFTLPLLQRLSVHANASTSPARHPIRALVLVPTRELAAQVHESVQNYGKHLQLRAAVIFGGVNINPQIKELQSGIDILVATPGRLLDHVQQRTLSLSQVEILVLDEADRMLDMGFIPDIRRIQTLIPPKRQTLLFSATFSDEIRKLASQFLTDPVQVEVARRNTAAENVRQVVHPVDRERKRALLAHLIKSRDLRQVLVFTKTKHGANRLASQLERDGIRAAAIHGDKAQSQRTQALDDFKQGVVQVLVATDIAARGLDIDQLPYVVNYELPHVAEDYVHRIGRTGRAGASGDAISLVSAEEDKLLAEIEKLIKRKIPAEVISGFDAHLPFESHDAATHQEPRLTGNGGSRRGRGEPRERSARREESRPTPSVRPVEPARPRQEEDRYANNPDQPVRSGRRPEERKQIAALFLPPKRTQPESGTQE
jgi:ATP-dependent RNA helicase RhlE